MGDNTTGGRVEASLKVWMTWSVEKQGWTVDPVNNDGFPLYYAAEPELVYEDEDGTATEADLDAASRSDVFVRDLHVLLAEMLGR